MDSSEGRSKDNSEYKKKIKKPPLHYSSQSQSQSQQYRPPIPNIIYSLPPKVVHVKSCDFKAIVQKLTGWNPSSTSTSTSSDSDDASATPSAAYIAAVENLQSKKRRMIITSYGNGTFITMDDQNETQESMANDCGILTPTPTSLPPIPSNYFTPPPAFELPFHLDNFSQNLPHLLPQYENRTDFMAGEEEPNFVIPNPNQYQYPSPGFRSHPTIISQHVNSNNYMDERENSIIPANPMIPNQYPYQEFKNPNDPQAPQHFHSPNNPPQDYFFNFDIPDFK